MSVTGNTKKVAEAIYGGIGGTKEIKPMDQVSNLDWYDLVFVGFPIHSFNVPAPAKEFLQNRAKGKRIALFYTHASFADPKLMPESVDLVKLIQKNVSDAASGSKVMGVFDCRGVLAEEVAKKCLSNPDPKVQMFGKVQPMTVGHPDATELSKAKDFALEMMARR
jgi:flavodoxin